MESIRRCLGSRYLVAVIWALALQVPTASTINIPEPTGPYQVGVSTHTIKHFNANDPLAPNNVSTAFLATIFYPTLQKPEDAARPYLNPETAAYYEKSWNYTSGVLSSITSTVQKNAPFLQGAVGESPYPTILFGPGGVGPPVEGSTILLSELASYGYTVIGLDHPFEQPFLRFPNGTGVYGIDVDLNNTQLLDAIYETRLIDNAAFLESLSIFVETLKAPINTTHIGVLGYSLGGAAALGSSYYDERIISGLNLDGSLFGRSTSANADIKKPILLLGNQEHHTGAQTEDITWDIFIALQTGSLREMSINGTTHHDFCDDTFWKTIEGNDPTTGPIDGNRQVEILNAYVKAFFDFTLLGHDSPILNGPSSEWPEVSYYNVSRAGSST
ncbi:uncharacterized protein F4822DRAFT_95135 [Hypoxylon trugodes]|uniref:uncharacterized protein n=1 Tax=Hypoxylon trugodes TaxID=326681 RepID=UPI00219EED16|nr:uncharacterized protein F4822DRAFT_95135 [Hypoxylon trugodes]KAI1382729.1 hypothetical protein F4822DRAFT_95135 [Hypoxylon trugodes]